ncbi:MAG: efflux RND transporter periplasmic adaptor subunit [Bacteroidales bacterium]|jgi:RND family efflux transporter MFP subunit|nr:efflux RND transporter periplasmic adaptor subunit [Bacteroidales bacterium]
MKNLKRMTLLAVLPMILWSCGGKKVQISSDEDRIEQVQVLTLEKREIARKLELSSTLQGYEFMNISPSLQGAHVERILVDVGSRVSKGQLLVNMEPTQLNAQRITLASLNTELERVRLLKESGSATQQAYDQLKAQRDALQENVHFIESNTTVYAPYSGVISARNIETGELYTGAVPILTLTQISTLKALINIPESYYPKIKQGMKSVITSEIFPDKEFTGIVDIIYPTIDPTSHSFSVQLKIANGNEQLRPGMYVKSTMELGNVEAVLVPYQSVLKLQGSNERYVFINNNGKAKRVSVKLGQRFDDEVEILSNEISEGMQIIVTGQARLVDGVTLNITK